MSGGNDKEAFLRTVAEALGRSRPLAKAPDYALLKVPLEQQHQKVNTILARIAARRAELVERFADMAQKGGWNVARVATPQEAAEHVLSVARHWEARSVVRAAQPVFKRVHPDEALKQAGLSVAVLAQAAGGTEESIRQAAADADVGITGVDYAIAETGTCVLLARRGVSRLVSLLPTVHIAIVEPEQLVETIDDVLALERLAFLKGEADGYMSFITGPSRSGDIEQTITIGVHGPKEVHCVLLG